MRILLVGAGGVGAAFCSIVARRDFFDAVVVADYDLARAEKAAAEDDRFLPARVDASDARSVTSLAREHSITHVLNAVDPRFVMPVFDWAYAADADFIDMAMILSRLYPQVPDEHIVFKLGVEQYSNMGV